MSQWQYNPGSESRARAKTANSILRKLFPISKTIHCPSCGSENNMHSGDKPLERPKDGDVSMCFYCGELQVFVVRGDDLSLRHPTDEEAAVITNDPRIQATRRLIAENITPTEAVLKRWGLM